jgi:putative Holliday junction resolvase
MTRRVGKRLPVTQLLARATELEAQGFVIGLALDGAGEETERSREARRLGDSLGARSGLPVRFVDERFTTAAALRAVREMQGSTRGRRGDVDSLAATLLLRAALDQKE